MGDDWIPIQDMWDLEPWYKNFYENTAMVQFNHRVLGMSTAAAALGLVGVGLSPARAKLLTPQARKGLYAVGLASMGQVTLGITTLLHYVPISLAAAHQVGSIVVLTSGIYLAHSLRYARPALVRAAGRVGASTKLPSSPSANRAVSGASA